MYQELDGWQTIKGDICLKSAKKQGMGQIEEYQNLELQDEKSGDKSNCLERLRYFRFFN